MITILLKRAAMVVALTAGLFYVSLSRGETSATLTGPTELRLQSLQKEYTEMAQQVRAGQEHLLRLEGAIGILTQMKDDTATATETTTVPPETEPTKTE